MLLYVQGHMAIYIQSFPLFLSVGKKTLSKAALNSLLKMV